MKRAVALGAVLLALASLSPAAAQAADDSVPSSTSEAPESPTTTVELSSPTITSTVPPVTTVTTTAPAPSVPATTVPTQVLGAQETNDGGELALTGLDVGALAGFGLALVAAGSAAAVRSRRV